MKKTKSKKKTKSNRYNGWMPIAVSYDLKLTKKIKKLIEEEQ